MKLIIYFLFFINIAFSKIPAVFEIEQNLSKQIEHVLHMYDPKGFVVIKSKVQARKINVPLTSITFDQFHLPEEEGVFKFSEIEIKVFGKDESLPENFFNLTKEIVAKFHTEPIISYNQIKLPMSEDSRNVNEPFWNNEKKQWIFEKFIYGIFFILFVSLLWIIHTKNKEQIERAISVFKEKKDDPQVYEQKASEKNSKERLDNEKNNSVSLSLKNNTIEALGVDGLIAILSDCYWSKEDNYAAYIWRNITIEKKEKILSKVPFINDYAILISRLTEENLELEQSPYYLNPFPIVNISNEALVKIVKQNPGIFKRLSTLRARNLPLSIGERFQIMQNNDIVNELHVISELKKINTSKERVLPSNSLYIAKTIDEEIEILNFKKPTIELVESVLSLAWLAHLDEYEIVFILNIFTAKELASCWVGPTELLDKLGQFLPNKKYDLIRSYVSKINPTRDSLVLKMIHSETIKKMRESKVVNSAA